MSTASTNFDNVTNIGYISTEVFQPYSRRPYFGGSQLKFSSNEMESVHQGSVRQNILLRTKNFWMPHRQRNHREKWTRSLFEQPLNHLSFSNQLVRVPAATGRSLVNYSSHRNVSTDSNSFRPHMFGRSLSAHRHTRYFSPSCGEITLEIDSNSFIIVLIILRNRGVSSLEHC